MLNSATHFPKSQHHRYLIGSLTPFCNYIRFAIEVISAAHALIFYEQRFFATQPQCCLTFSWIGLQMLLRCCLIHISVIILRHFLYLLYLCPCLDLGLFLSYICDLFFIFIFIFIMINCISQEYRDTYSFDYFLRCVLSFLDDMDEECE